jgi:hypothetical protein
VFDAAPETVQAIRDWVTTEWQCTLASASGGGIAPHGGHGVAGVELFPGHSGTDPGCYDSDAGQTFAAATVDALAAGTFAFDASDQMPAAVGQGTFWSGMIDWSQGASSQAVADAIEESWPG